PQWTSNDLHLVPFLQKGMRIVPEFALDEGPDRPNLMLRDELRSISEPDDRDHAERLEHGQPIRVTKASGAIARKQRHLDLFGPIAPPAEAPVEGQKRLNARARGELVANTFFVAGPRVERVPARLHNELGIAGRDDVDQRFHFSRSAVKVVP